MSCCCQNPAPVAPAVTPQAMVWLKLGIAALFSGLTMYLSLGANIGDPQGSTRTIIHTLLATVSLAAMIGLAGGMFADAWRSLRRREMTLEHAFLIGIIGAFSASLSCTITHQGAIYYEVVVVLIAIYLFGQTIKKSVVEQQQNLSDSIPGLYGTTTVIRDGEAQEVSVKTIAKGEHIIVSESQVVPIDCQITEGQAYIEQQAHTGETYPQVKGSGERLLAGSIVLDGKITAKATCAGTDREIDRLLSSLNSASSNTTKAEVLAQKILSKFVPIVLAIALLTGIIWSLFGHPLEGWLHALTVTVVACPCALGIAIPLATQRGLSALKLFGIIPKEASYLDRLAGIDHVAFDKTGTLSRPSLELASFDLEESVPPKIKDWVAAIQKHSSHPVARPFWKLGSAERVTFPDLLVENIPGRGIRATFTNEGQPQEILIGNDHLLADLSLTPRADTASRALFIIQHNRIVATAQLSESSRAESAQTLKSLAQAGYQISILTGDSSVPDEYQISNLTIKSGLTSEEKADYLERAAKTTHALYVGDGLNDCEGFQHAHASLALTSGSQAAQKVAHATLLHDDLSVIPKAIAVVKQLQKNLTKILLFSFIYNSIGITLAALGLLHPIVAAILMFTSSIFVISFRGRLPKGSGERLVEPLSVPREKRLI
ncbi:MAG: P-type E1-E2 ATPase [Akkermansiaceae bacterium]|jgi:P-type E1-E2 ATPase